MLLQEIIDSLLIHQITQAVIGEHNLITPVSKAYLLRFSIYLVTIITENSMNSVGNC